MNFLKIIAAVSFFSLFAFACAQAGNFDSTTKTGTAVSANTAPAAAVQPATAAVDDLASARKIYSESCVQCHKENGVGGISRIDGKNVKAPNFTSERQKGEPDSEYVEIIENGEAEDGMPAYKGKISDDDIKNLVKYIRREFQGK